MSDLRACLITTAKNEAPYFLEWVVHHQALGFSDIIIFQNDSDDLTHQTLRCLHDIGAIRYFYNRAAPGRHQVRAYERAANLPEFRDADWAMAIDLDEFLVVKTGGGQLIDLLDATPIADCMHLNWRLFGHSGHETLTDDLVTNRFVLADHQLGAEDHFTAYKSLFKPTHFRRAGVHRPADPQMDKQKLRYCNGSALRPGDYALRNFNSTGPNSCDLAQINHYITRDLASFMLKTVRGSAHQSNRVIGKKYWLNRNKNYAADQSMAPWLERICEGMERLNRLSNGRLMQLRSQSIALHMDRFEALQEDPAHRNMMAFCKSNPNLSDEAELMLDAVREERRTLEAA